MDGSQWRVLTKCGPTEKGMAKHSYTAALRTLNSMKRQNDMTPEEEPSTSVGVQCATGEEQRNSSRENE